MAATRLEKSCSKARQARVTTGETGRTQPQEEGGATTQGAATEELQGKEDVEREAVKSEGLENNVVVSVHVRSQQSCTVACHSHTSTHPSRRLFSEY